jgi:membrane protein required for colicin V production
MMIDIIFAIIIVYACIKGFQKGLILALFSVVAFIIGLAAALKLSTVVAGWIGSSTNVSSKWLPFISFIVVFFAVVLLVRWGGKLIEKSIQVVMLGWLNRLGGIIFYAALYIIIFSIFLFYAKLMGFVTPETIQASATYEYVQPWGPKVINGFGKVIPVFQDMFSSLEQFFGGLSNKISH